MQTSTIPYQRLRFFSGIIKDYLDQKESVEELYHRFPTLENFHEQLKEKAGQRDLETQRKVLKERLMYQYNDIPDAEATVENIKLLADKKTFTITTGHQLNLFTGPLYFLYKIISTINLCKQLKVEHGEYNFVPVYWMATEDHDFEEIQYFNFGDRKLVYDRESHGAVGRLNTEDLNELKDQFRILLGSTKYAKELIQLFTDSYLLDNLAKATQYLAHQLFKNEGLVIVDADDRELKSLAVPFFETELTQQVSHQEVTKTLDQWNSNYKVQVNPREINLFYLTNAGRYRIVKKEDRFYLDGAEDSFSENEILQELHDYPERFSPNVIMRPLYQEIILPNLCYIGGGGEIAYWLQLKSYFESQEIPFPILLLRNSAMLMNIKQTEKLTKLDLVPEDLFKEEYQLEKQIVEQVSQINIDFSKQKAFLNEQFKELNELALETDPSFLGAVGAQERKQIKGLENLEKRLLQAQKRKWKDQVGRATALQKELFPNNSLQERQANFSYFYKDQGPDLIEQLLQELNPLDFGFTVVEL